VKARVFQLHTGEHDAVQGILPWFVNGTLDASQAQRVRDHLADCVQCRADLAWQQRLRAAAPHEAPSGAAHVADRQWAALARRIVEAFLHLDANQLSRQAARQHRPAETAFTSAALQCPGFWQNVGKEAAWHWISRAGWPSSPARAAAWVASTPWRSRSAARRWS
jgi:hypothetical protein